MARKSLAELKKHLKSKGNGGSSYYPFTKMPEGEEVHGRIIVDSDETNEDDFFVETRNHKISIGGKDKFIPCIYMYGDKCPVCDRSRKYYDAGDEINGKYYYRNLSFLVRMAITKDPLPPGENGSALHTVQRLSFTKDVLNYVINGIANFDDCEAMPWDLRQGCDFIIKKGSKNIPDPKDKSKMKVVPDYSASTFARKASSLPDEVIAQMEATQLPPLKSLRSKHPGLEKILAMLEAHDTGADYQDDENSAGDNANTQTAKTINTTEAEVNAPASNKVAAEAPEETPAPVAEAVTSKSEEPTSVASAPSEDDDIMARIKNRNKPTK